MSDPAAYNIALDCVDRYARFLQTKHQRALTAVTYGAQGLQARHLTFDNLYGLTNRVANVLRALGGSRGGRVIIRLPNGPDFPIAFLGAIKAAMIPVPTSPLLTEDELSFLLEDSEAEVLITTQELLPEGMTKDRFAALKEILVHTDEPPSEGLLRWQDQIKHASPSFETEPTSAEDPAYWLYTSGTEERPKAVIHAHRSIPAHDERVRSWQDLNQDDVIFNTSQLNWSYALTCSLLDAWRHRVQTVVYDGPLDAPVLCDIIRRFHVTVFMSVPGIYRRLLRDLAEDPRELGSLRIALSAGEALPETLRTRFRKRTGLEIREGLGMTEHSVYLVQPKGETAHSGSCGRPLAGNRIAVMREDLTEADPGEVGTLASHRSCPGLMIGYHHRPELEKVVWQGEWFLSGDMAYRDAEGRYYFVGRRDDMMNAGGYRVSPREVESVLDRHPKVAESAVVSVRVETGKNIIRAFIVAKGDAPTTLPQDIIAFASEHLAQYKVPRDVILCERLPRTVTGKLKRASLRYEA